MNQMNIANMWEKLNNHSKKVFSGLNSNTDEYYINVKETLFYTLSLLITNDADLTNECTYWCKLIKMTHEYGHSEDVESKFENLIIDSNNAQALRYYDVFFKEQRGYGCFFSLLNTEIKSFVLDEFGFELYLRYVY